MEFEDSKCFIEQPLYKIENFDPNDPTVTLPNYTSLDSNIKNCNYYILPLNVNRSHWLTIIIINHHDNYYELVIQDSLNYDVSSFEKHILQWLKEVTNNEKLSMKRRNDLEKSKL